MTTGKKVTVADDPLTPVPLDMRQHWITPATIFGGLEFCVPILMIGATLAASFSLTAVIPIILFAFIAIQWAGNAVNGYIGAKTGRASSVVARCGFGSVQARIIIALVIFLACLGWWSLQTSVAGNSICAMLGIDYNLPENRGLWMLITIIAGAVFAVPSVIGYSSMKWTDYISVPAGLLLCAFGIYLGISSGGGIAKMFAHIPGAPAIGVIAAVNIILGMNISQWIISADYTRYAKPRVTDNILIPLGIIAIGIPLMFVGAVMSVGQGTADIVEVMVKLGFPFWGFIVLWLSTWTSQLVNNYTMGLSFSNLLNVSSNKGRMILTLVGTFIALIAAISGILNYFTDFLYLSSLAYAPIAGVIFSDFFMRSGEWEDHGGWNWVATAALACGVAMGYVTTYVSPFGIPILQSIALTALVYVIGTKIKAGVAPDEFTPSRFLRDGK
jgi:cytosine permease